MGILDETIESIKGVDKKAFEPPRKEWDSIAHPTGSLGELEELTIKIAGIQGNIFPLVKSRALIVMASDNGIIEENISSGYPDLTSQLVYSMAQRKTGAANMCLETDTEIYVVDLGTRREINHENVLHFRINSETKNFRKEPAMTVEEATKAIETGIYMVDELVKKGIDIFGTGELGIGNTTTSAAVLAALLKTDGETTCGLGAGVTNEGLKNKVNVVNEAIKKYDLYNKTPIEILACVGGYDICGLVGVFLGAAKHKKVALIDGFISAIAALVAVRMNEHVIDYIIPSHKSREKQVELVFNELGLHPTLDLSMRLGEGTGCMLLFKILDTAVYLMRNMGRYEEIEILPDVLVNIRDKND